MQSFNGVVRPLGETRPAWKVLRVLGNLLGLAGFAQESVEEVRAEALGDPADLASRLDNRSPVAIELPAPTTGWQRLADVPIYSTDSLVRRAPALQATADAAPPQVSLPSALWQQLGLQSGDRVRVSQGGASVVLPAREDPGLAAQTVRVPAGHADTACLGPMFGPITVEAA